MRSSSSLRRCRPPYRPLLLERLESRVVPGFLAPLAFDTGSSPWSVAVGDFNGDGKPDLAVANEGDLGVGDYGNVSILLGNGDGTFQSAHNIVAGKNPVSIVVGDFNGDGRLDIAVANNGINIQGGWLPGNVSVLLGNGDGTFQDHVDYPTGSGPVSVATGDFNGDGKLDLAVAALAGILSPPLRVSRTLDGRSGRSGL